MEDQRQRLSAIFKQREVSLSDDEGDDNTSGEYWEFRDPEEVEFWSIALVPMTDKTHFVHKFRNASTPLHISVDEKIIDIGVQKGSTVEIACETTVDVPYKFTICVDISTSPFNLQEFLTSLGGTNYTTIVTEVEDQIDKGQWMTKDRKPLKAKALTSKLRNLLLNIATQSAVNARVSEVRRHPDLTRQVMSQGGSQGSAQFTTPGATTGSRGKRVATPSSSKRPATRSTPNPESSTAKRSRTDPMAEPSTTSVLTDLPSEYKRGDEIDYSEAKTIYQKFWTECQDCFIFETDTKFEIPIHQMDRAPADWTIRAYEESGMLHMRHYLINMPDKTAKQTLCVMPECNEKPSTWEQISEGRFYILNGQHSVAASESIIREKLCPDSEIKHFEKWNCFIVWSLNKEKLRRISAYYNRVNHFSVFKPDWSTNVLNSRFIWTELGCPKPPKTAVQAGRKVTRSKQSIMEVKKYNVSENPHS